MTASSSYTVTYTRGCRVIDRPIPISDLVALMNAWESLATPDDPWIADALLSQYCDAAIVVGPVSATTAWRAELGLSAPPPAQD
jgi:hypothetical protein